MRKILLLSFFCSLYVSTFAQLKMRDVLAQLPDSVLPLMTRNNRLDCIDFIENNMEARVKNRFDDPVVLDALTYDFLSIRTSESSYVEMKLIPQANDTLICVNRTYFGPAEDSEVKLYDMNWKFVRAVQRPDVKEFLKSSDFIQPWTKEMTDTLAMIHAEANFLSLIKASLSKETTQIVWTLQTQEFSKEIKMVAEKYLQSISKEL